MINIAAIAKIGFKFLQRNFIIILLSILGGSLLFVTQKKINIWYQNLFPQEKRIGVLGRYNLNDLPEEISSLISFGLTKLSSNGSPLPAAAESWEIENQGKKYTFQLDNTLTWHNGSQLKANDVKYNIKGSKISYPNDSTVVFELEDPFSPLPALVSKPLFKKKNAGLGEYRIKKFRFTSNYLSMLKLQSRENGRTIVFRFYPNQKALKNAIKLREIDCAKGVGDVGEFESWKQIEITPYRDTKKYVALFFNTKKDPFSSKSFRQFLAYGFRKPEAQLRATGPISPLSWAYNKNVKTYQFNPEHARKILENNNLKNITKKVKINIMTTIELVSWAERIKEDWKKHLGIESNIQVVPVISQLSDFDVILGYGISPDDPDQYYFWHTDQPGNITGYSNPRIDKLLEEGRKVFTKEERKKIYQDFQRFLLEDVPAIFLFHPESNEVCYKGRGVG
jgi:peptide/nickel transport system substrate-binding protein